ncbi:MAG: isoprenylcysteine carboxylmethyltransferase family protein [Actinomycetota bacterium]|nr:isoprenylcysteine carboxylmethyltransferase family protein [Actinomycetota bacterium]
MSGITSRVTSPPPSGWIGVVRDRLFVALVAPWILWELGTDLYGHVRAGIASFTEGADVLRSLLVLGFYLTIFWALLTRLPPKSRTRAPAVRFAAFAGTFLPAAIPPLTSPSQDVLLLAIGNGVILAGLAWSLWSLHALRHSFSVVPAGRELVTSGPYRYVRHPLYLGELTAAFGLVIGGPTLAALALWSLLAALQLFRAIHEERLLAATFPEYDDYRSNTGRILPTLHTRRAAC